MSDWLQVCLVSSTLQRGRTRRRGKDRQGKDTQNTEPSQYPPLKGHHPAAYQAFQGTANKTLSTGQGPR